MLYKDFGLSSKELEQLKVEVENYLDSPFYEEEKEFAIEGYLHGDFELVSGFYSGFKTALFINKYYPELLKE